MTRTNLDRITATIGAVAFTEKECVRATEAPLYKKYYKQEDCEITTATCMKFFMQIRLKQLGSSPLPLSMHFSTSSFYGETFTEDTLYKQANDTLYKQVDFSQTHLSGSCLREFHQVGVTPCM